MKDQIRLVTRFKDFFNNVTRDDCFCDKSVFPIYPREIFQFSYSAYLLPDFPDISHKFNRIKTKYNGTNLGDDYENQRKILVKNVNFYELEVLLEKFIEVEHKCDGWYIGAIEENLFYHIILRLEEYSNLIDIQNLEVPSLIFDDFETSTKNIQDYYLYLKDNRISHYKQKKDKILINEINTEEDSLEDIFKKYNSDILVTITGYNHYQGIEPFKVNNIFRLIKDIDNEFDDESIVIKTDLGVKVGYVANSSYTVINGTFSAGRLYDKIEDNDHIEVIFNNENIIIARLFKK